MIAAPMNGPRIVPVPPRMPISTASAEAWNVAAAGDTKRFQYA